MTSDSHMATFLENDLADLRSRYEASLKALLHGDESERVDLLRRAHARAVAYFNKFEQTIIIGSVSKLDRDSSWFTDRAESAINHLEHVLRWNAMLKAECSKCGLSMADFAPSTTSFANSQRLVKLACPDDAARLRNQFVDADLPTRGFDVSERTKAPSWYPRVAIASALIFVAVLILIAIAIPNPSGFQVFVFRVILALAAGAFAWLLTGTILVGVTIGKWLRVDATAGFGLFVIIYFVNPPMLVISGSEDDQRIDAPVGPEAEGTANHDSAIE